MDKMKFFRVKKPFRNFF